MASTLDGGHSGARSVPSLAAACRSRADRMFHVAADDPRSDSPTDPRNERSHTPNRSCAIPARASPGHSGASGRQPDGIALGITHTDKPASPFRALLRSIKLCALITKTAHHVAEIGIHPVPGSSRIRSGWSVASARTVQLPGMVSVQNSPTSSHPIPRSRTSRYQATIPSKSPPDLNRLVLLVGTDRNCS